MSDKMDYKKSGVNLEAADRAVDKIRAIAGSATRPEVISGIGGFGGLFALDKEKYKNPVLVSGTDGVGTKLKLAIEMEKHDTVGEDCVAMCVNDILVQGAEPLFFMDYLAVGKLNPGQVAEIVSGVANGCRKAGCALLGGETAEMPGFYPPGEYDLAGFAVGAADRDKIVDGTGIEKGDVLIGLASSGVHSNGFSLVRKILDVKGLQLKDIFSPESTEDGVNGTTLGDELLKPTEIYVAAILPLLTEMRVKGMAHITGGGLPGNLPRILPPGLDIKLFTGRWEIPPVFDFISRQGNVDTEEMYRVFNMGIGFVLIVSGGDAEKARSSLNDTFAKETWVIGEVTAGKGAGGKIIL